jgi:hypothetical protein
MTNLEPKKETENKFKLYWVQLPVIEASIYKDRFKRTFGWSRAVWYNKLHGITPFTLAEMRPIATAFRDDVENIFDLTTKQRECLNDDGN